MSSVLSPSYTQGPYVNTEVNAELEAAILDAGATFDTVEYLAHGKADSTGIAPGRRVLNLPGITWPATPDTCADESGAGQWVLDDLVLVCRGCGLDCT